MAKCFQLVPFGSPKGNIDDFAVVEETIGIGFLSFDTVRLCRRHDEWSFNILKDSEIIMNMPLKEKDAYEIDKGYVLS